MYGHFDTKYNQYELHLGVQILIIQLASGIPLKEIGIFFA